MIVRKAPERRLFFSINFDDCAALIAELGKAGAHWTAQTKVLSLYLDTDDCAIGKLGFGFGIRRRGDGTLNDLNTALRRFSRGQPGQNGWTTFRHALTVETPRDARHVQSFLHTPESRQRLRTIFQSEAQRSFWSLPFAGGEAGVILEQAGIVNGGKHNLALLELTYPATLARDALAFIATIGKIIRLRLTGETLARAAYRMSGHPDIALPGAVKPRLRPDMSAGMAFRTIAQATLDHFILAQSGLLFSRDSERVHQCRVALRRFSSAQRLFSEFVVGEDIDDIKEDMRPFKNLLRTARELDVRLNDISRLAVDEPDLPTTSVRELLEARREGIYDQLVAKLEDPQMETLMLRLAGWIDSGDWMQDPARAKDRDQSILRFARRRFTTLAEKFRRRCKDLEHANHKERHRTRIHAKNLRYGVEFFDAFTEGARRRTLRKRQKAFVGALKHMQTFLGDENDTVMAHHYFADLTEDDDLSPASDDAVVSGKELAHHLMPMNKRKFRKSVAKTRQELFEVRAFWRDLTRN